MLKVSHKEVCYEQDGETIYLCDKRGYVGIQTDDLTVLADMAKRGIELTEKAGLKQQMEQIMRKYKPEDMFTYSATGIQFPYWDSSAGKKKDDDYVPRSKSGIFRQAGRRSLCRDF